MIRESENSYSREKYAPLTLWGMFGLHDRRDKCQKMGTKNSRNLIIHTVVDGPQVTETDKWMTNNLPEA
jgi:hypothetical protein